MLRALPVLRHAYLRLGMLQADLLYMLGRMRSSRCSHFTHLLHEGRAKRGGLYVSPLPFWLKVVSKIKLHLSVVGFTSCRHKLVAVFRVQG